MGATGQGSVCSARNKGCKIGHLFVISGTWLSGDDLPVDVFRTASEDEKTPKQWVDEFFPYARARASKHTRLEEEDGEEEDYLTAEYQFGMDLDAIGMPRMVVWSPVPTVVYPKFMAEDEVRQLEDDGPYATKMREAIIGVRGQLADLNWLHAKMRS